MTQRRPGRCALPAALAERERAAVRARRSALGLPLDPDESSGRVGLAISGGGIRSATFALGVLQSLAGLGRLRQVDYLSSVSGGGYVGSFLGSLYLPDAARTLAATRLSTDAGAPPTEAAAATAAQTADRVERTLADASSPPLAWLRENGRYMAPRGAGDYLYAAAIMVRNWVALHYVLAVTALAGFLSADLLRAVLWRQSAWLRALEARLSAEAGGGLWWSPWAALALAGLALVLVPIGWAYWLTQTHRRSGWPTSNPALIATLLIALGAAALWRWGGASAGLPAAAQHAAAVAARYLVYAACAAILTWIVARVGVDNEGVARNRLSSWLASALAATLALTAYALVDSLGQSALAAVHIASPRWWGALIAVAPAIAALVHRFAPLIARLGMKERGWRLSSATVLSIVGVVLFSALLVLWSALGHALMWSGQCLDCAGVSPAPQLAPMATALAALVLIGLLTARTIPFLNLSTLAQFYAARLTRAYLGASNVRRTGYRSDAPAAPPPTANSIHHDVTRAEIADDIPWDEYHPERHGGPLHLVNVTVNETLSGTSQLAQRDRKGLPMAIGPCGLSVGRDHHALWNGDDGHITALPVPEGRFAVFPASTGRTRRIERLSLGQWVAISGAAFTTGLGARTRLGLSMLLAISNVRLGYWWDSGVAPRERADRSVRRGLGAVGALLSALVPVQAYLANETLARFHGPHRRRWYLSDGGHFENTAVYELLRRRVPFIIVCDDGQDADYTFADIGNLVRKARIDWDAEIRFLATDEIETLLGSDSPLLRDIGTPAQLQPRSHESTPGTPSRQLKGRAWSQRHATLAWARYGVDPQARSLLLFIKPTLTGDEPMDVQDYFVEHPDFP
ncbi:MAG: patatin-like phospholipase family protein, partial [Burkholderiaceae bacterium]|nr:patatin-like phospholipase family protein [Burkholderiaceae bacterium]